MTADARVPSRVEPASRRTPHAGRASRALAAGLVALTVAAAGGCESTHVHAQEEEPAASTAAPTPAVTTAPGVPDEGWRVRWPRSTGELAPLRPAAGAPAPSSPVDAVHRSDTFADALWDDGRAEVLRYEGVRRIYGQDRAYELVMIVVKEDLDSDTLVKSDRPDDVETLPALKLHQVMTIDAGAYPYQYASTTLVDRANPFVLRKMAVTSSEWCGITTRTLWRRGDSLVGTTHSYFDGEADESLDLPFAGAVSEEQLLVAARALALNRPERTWFPLRVLELQTDSRVRTMRARDAEAHLFEEETVTDAAGNEHRVRPLQVHVYEGDWEGTEDMRPRSGHVRIPAGTIRVDVEVAAPHRVIRYTSPWMGTLVLRESERDAYWAR